MKFLYPELADVAGIYKITNTHTGRVYIGQAASFKKRWKTHAQDLYKSRHGNKFLQHDFDKCRVELGHDDFLVFSVLEAMPGSTRLARDARETQFIASIYDNQSMCYNFRRDVPTEKSCFSNTPDATRELHRKHAIERDLARHLPDRRGVKFTEEHKARISVALMGRKGPPSPLRGRHPSEETRKRMGEAQRKAQSGKPGRHTGHKHSEEARKKMSDAHKTRAPVSDATRKKQSEVMTLIRARKKAEAGIAMAKQFDADGMVA